jgi:hypothetical protein
MDAAPSSPAVASSTPQVDAAPGALEEPFTRVTIVPVGHTLGEIVPASVGKFGEAPRWTPTLSAIDAFEKGLAAYLRKVAPEQKPDLYAHLDEYRRQYVGGLDPEHHRFLSVLFMCRVDEWWGKGPIVIFDGGSCFFEMSYDVDTGKYEDVYVHGE